MSKADAIRTLQRALRVLELPDAAPEDPGAWRTDGVDKATASYKVGWAKGAIKDALKDLGAKL